MKKALLPLTLLTTILLFCNFRYITPSAVSENEKNNINNISCECGIEDTAFLPDTNPPVFNFYNATFTKSARMGISEQVIAPYCSNITNPKSVLGTPDGNGTRISPNGKLIVKLSSMLTAGNTLTLYWRQETGEPEQSTLILKQLKTLNELSSGDSAVFSTNNEDYYPATVYINSDTRFLEFNCQGDASLRIDAVTYFISDGQTAAAVPVDTIENLMDAKMPLVTDDCDRLVDIDYVDSVENEITDLPQVIKRIYIAIDDCGNISYASQTFVLVDPTQSLAPDSVGQNSSRTPLPEPNDFKFAIETMHAFNKDVIGANKSLGFPDLTMAQLKPDGKLTIKLTDNLSKGSGYSINIKQNLNDQPTMLYVLESFDLIKWEQNGEYSVTPDNEGGVVISFIAQSNTRYLKVCNNGSTDAFIDAIGSNNIRAIEQ